MKPTHLQNVSRYEHKRWRAWHVQIRRRGRLHHRYFADGQWGGKQKALEAAIAFRDQTIEKLPPLLFLRHRWVHNKTGVIGVRIQAYRTRFGTYRSYVASWPGPPGRRTRTFAFKKYGKQRAFELAVKARRQGIAHLLRTAPKTVPLHRPRRHRPRNRR